MMVGINKNEARLLLELIHPYYLEHLESSTPVNVDLL